MIPPKEKRGKNQKKKTRRYSTQKTKRQTRTKRQHQNQRRSCSLEPERRRQSTSEDAPVITFTDLDDKTVNEAIRLLQSRIQWLKKYDQAGSFLKLDSEMEFFHVQQRKK